MLDYIGLFWIILGFDGYILVTLRIHKMEFKPLFRLFNKEPGIGEMLYL